jgi:predicted RND superfamily exporter protein
LVAAGEPPAALTHLLQMGRDLEPPAAAPKQAPDRDGMLAALDAIAKALDQLRRLAKMDDAKELTDALHETERDVAAAKAAFTATSPGQAAALLAPFPARIARELGRVREQLVAVERAVPYTLATLPAELKHRYVGADGSLATYVWPARDVSDRAAAKAFVAAVESAGLPCAGTPVMECRMLDMIRDGFAQAALVALVIIVVLVVADFRSARLAALGLLPMGCGTVAALGLLALSGRAWNPVNSMALPVLLGEGVGFGVNLVHRWLAERSVSVAVAGTGRAVVYCGATSITGFGSLMLADHRGLSSFGFVMAVGTLGSMLTGLVVLPRVLSFLTPPGPKDGSE